MHSIWSKSWAFWPTLTVTLSTLLLEWGSPKSATVNGGAPFSFQDKKEYNWLVPPIPQVGNSLLAQSPKENNYEAGGYLHLRGYNTLASLELLGHNSPPLGLFTCGVPLWRGTKYLLARVDLTRVWVTRCGVPLDHCWKKWIEGQHTHVKAQMPLKGSFVMGLNFAHLQPIIVSSLCGLGDWTWKSRGLWMVIDPLHKHLSQKEVDPTVLGTYAKEVPSWILANTLVCLYHFWDETAIQHGEGIIYLPLVHTKKQFYSNYLCFL